MKKFKFDCKLKRQIENVYKMIKYAYLEDSSIKGENIHYGENKKQYYRVYKNVNNKDITICFIHGGGWWQGSPKLYSGVGKYFYKKGYNIVLIGYRLVPTFTYPCQINDCFEALKHYTTTNTDRILIGGYSAGAELACHLVFNEDKQILYNINKQLIKGFFSIAGVLNFDKCISKSSKKLIKNYTNGLKINKCNPIDLLKSNVSIPTLCLHGDNDTLISVENSITFANKLKDLNSNVSLCIIEGIDHEHAIDIARGEGNIYSNKILEFIKKLE